VVIGYWLIPRRAGRWWLVLASLLFYASWNALYVPGFVALIAANWLLGFAAAGPHRRMAITVAVLLDLGVLGVFKYLDFTIGSSASIITLLTGRELDLPVLGLILPLAISFVTFTLLAYVFDIGRGARPERSPLRFGLFVSFFPHLIAGPIMRAHEFLPQVRHPRPFSTAYLGIAAPLLIGGLAKKTLGDQLAPRVMPVFDDPAAYSTAGLWLGVIAFGFQIYLDFSGYTDMALGSAALLGFRLPRNFDWPYRAGSAQEFWRRWHMTLSRWLRDYVYIPLGGSRHGRARTYFALMTTMTLGGLWHGAGLTFVVWGIWHGIGLSVHRWWRERPTPIPIPQLAAWALTFAFVMLGWVFFRAASMDDALVMIRGMLTPQSGRLGFTRPEILVLAAAVIAQWPLIAGWTRAAAPAGSLRRYAAYGTLLLATLLALPVARLDFIYFQF
jgi:D-alanyl-lipoteichoic acid acyltransferase DltB (MBOAT superfamily)